jgi:hypothetical protein
LMDRVHAHITSGTSGTGGGGAVAVAHTTTLESLHRPIDGVPEKAVVSCSLRNSLCDKWRRVSLAWDHISNPCHPISCRIKDQ